MNGYIYKFTHLPSNKIYVGQHSGDIFDEKYWGSGSIWLKILKNSNKNIDIRREVLEWCYDVTKEYLTERENYWINKLNSLDSRIGYNQCEAIENFWLGHHHTNEVKEKISKASHNRRWVNKDNVRKLVNKEELDNYIKLGWNLGSGLKISDEAREIKSMKCSNRVRLTNGEKNVFVLKELEKDYLNNGYVRGTTHLNNLHHSKYMTNGELERKINYAAQDKKLKLGWVFGTLNDFSEEELTVIYNNYILIKNKNEEIRKIKFSNKRKGHAVSEETKQKLREANLGKCCSNETREKISKASLGRKHTEETKQKLREINLGRKHTAETIEKLKKSHIGSQSDRIWINNGVINKRVTEKDFNEIYIKDNFIKGRKK